MGQGSGRMLAYERRMKGRQRRGLPSQDLQRHRRGRGPRKLVEARNAHLRSLWGLCPLIWELFSPNLIVLDRTLVLFSEHGANSPIPSPQVVHRKL